MTALRLQHEADLAVPIRVVRWGGTEKDAVLHRFSQTFLTLASKPVEVARQLAQVNALWNVPQQALAARIGWTESKVSKHLIAARGEKEEPRFAHLLLRPANPPINYMYQVDRAVEIAVKEDVNHPRRSNAKGEMAALRKRLEVLLAKKERFEPKGALVALGLAKAKPDPELPFNAPNETARAQGQEPFVLEDGIGRNDVLIGTLRVQVDGARRLTFPDVRTVEDMTAIEKVAARSAYHEAIEEEA